MAITSVYPVHVYQVFIWFTMVHGGKVFIKGFKLDREKIAKSFELQGSVKGTNPERIEVVIVLDDGDDEGRLQNLELSEIDDTVMKARPYTLVSPDVWELWG
ncbi:hypothetical protein BYT27DRAFT_7215760 [Phlegmacium glaucopus]|nr:hypothetical protein BYT27DRAFT_7215760 [Phlegmacium glaucopus]